MVKINSFSEEFILTCCVNSAKKAIPFMLFAPLNDAIRRIRQFQIQNEGTVLNVKTFNLQKIILRKDLGH
jgi:hypothetical protein